jgi:hypothetical protein
MEAAYVFKTLVTAYNSIQHYLNRTDDKNPFLNMPSVEIIP